MRLLLRLLTFSLFFALPVVLRAQAAPGSDRSQFGRFGRFNDDGLLTLNVTPHGFAAPPTAAPMQITYGEGRARAKVIAIGTTGKTLRLSGGSADEPTQLRYTLLYPGFGATYGRRMRLRVTDEKGKPIPVTMAYLPPNRDSEQCSGLLIRREDRASMPLLIAFRRGFEPRVKTLACLPDKTEIVVEGQEAIGDARFVTPLGLRELAPAASAAEENHLRAEARRWAAISIPIRAYSSHRLAPDGQAVTFTETYAPTSEGLPIAPLPPVLAFARAHGYPAAITGETVTADCPTKWGDFTYMRGNTARYTLPVPPTDERGYIRVGAEAEAASATQGNTRLLNELVGHLGGDWASNAVDLGYAGMANAQMAWAYLTPQRRSETQAAWQRYLPLAFTLPPYLPQPSSPRAPAKAALPRASTLETSSDTAKLPPCPWKTETEPFTGQSYLWTYFIAGPNQRRYDLDWGDALPLYGLYKYAQYTGDWAFVRAHWNDVRRIYRYFERGDDWAWMTVVNADHGYSTGTGDPMAATYCGTLACLKMARALKDKAGVEYFAAQAARIAVPTVARFRYTAWARKAGLIGPKSVVLGFHEMEGFTRARLGEDDPWDTTNVLSGDGVLPELYAVLRAFGGTALADYEAEYARNFPEWYRGDVVYPFATTYKGNSIYVTFPHIFARALLGEPTSALLNYVDMAQANRNNAWIGPNVLAELLSRSAPLLLTEWQPAALWDGVVSSDGKQVQLDFHLDTPRHKPVAWTLVGEAQNGRVPLAVTINGSPVPFQFRGTRLTVACRTQGNVRVLISY